MLNNQKTVAANFAELFDFTEEKAIDIYDQAAKDAFAFLRMQIYIASLMLGIPPLVDRR